MERWTSSATAIELPVICAIWRHFSPGRRTGFKSILGHNLPVQPDVGDLDPQTRETLHTQGLRWCSSGRSSCGWLQLMRPKQSQSQWWPIQAWLWPPRRRTFPNVVDLSVDERIVFGSDVSNIYYRLGVHSAFISPLRDASGSNLMQRDVRWRG